MLTSPGTSFHAGANKYRGGEPLPTAVTRCNELCNDAIKIRAPDLGVRIHTLPPQAMPGLGASDCSVLLPVKNLEIASAERRLTNAAAIAIEHGAYERQTLVLLRAQAW